MSAAYVELTVCIYLELQVYVMHIISGTLAALVAVIISEVFKETHSVATSRLNYLYSIWVHYLAKYELAICQIIQHRIGYETNSLFLYNKYLNTRNT